MRGHPPSPHPAEALTCCRWSRARCTAASCVATYWAMSATWRCMAASSWHMEPCRADPTAATPQQRLRWRLAALWAASKPVDTLMLLAAVMLDMMGGCDWCGHWRACEGRAGKVHVLPA
jgi:hypothetical protein